MSVEEKFRSGNSVQVERAVITRKELEAHDNALIKKCAEMNTKPVALTDDVYNIIKAVAHVGIDFGHGNYELEPKYIVSARAIVGKVLDEK